MSYTNMVHYARFILASHGAARGKTRRTTLLAPSCLVFHGKIAPLPSHGVKRLSHVTSRDVWRQWLGMARAGATDFCMARAAKKPALQLRPKQWKKLKNLPVKHARLAIGYWHRTFSDNYTYAYDNNIVDSRHGCSSGWGIDCSAACCGFRSHNVKIFIWSTSSCFR